MGYKAPTTAVISDAGFASRFLPITKTIPKAMIPLGAKPVMQLVVEECVEAGIKKIIIVSTREGKSIYEDYFQSGAEHVAKLLESQGKAKRFAPVREVLAMADVTVIEQDPSLPYGNGSPFKSAEPYLPEGEAFLGLYSDDVVLGGSGAVKALMKKFEEAPDADAIIAVQEVEGAEIEKYGSVEFQAGTEQLKRLIEKPKQEEAPSQLASYGRYLLTDKVFQYLTPRHTGKDAELWTADAIDAIVQAGGKVLTAQAEGTWHTTGDPQGYFEAMKVYLGEK
ncbi:sugar phosphate nucleotidyltransferase [Candidatus Saccharibacteria bacterium]|nr:sugar phosphate nucleotidyltransferase [Candidatus Saccharibacteria bacterium]